MHFLHHFLSKIGPIFRMWSGITYPLDPSNQGECGELVVQTSSGPQKGANQGFIETGDRVKASQGTIKVL